jgi:5-(carboxyamino)imidazole ribonucleotide mutase
MIVPILLGSENEMGHARSIIEVLDNYGVSHKLYMVSAHKAPTKVLEIVQDYNERKETVVFATIMGQSNALSGLVAAHSHFPVVACPHLSESADYLVNIHSSLQMPIDVPALTVLDPKNAGQAIVRLLSLNNKDLAKKVRNHIKVIQHSFDTKPIDHD